VRAKESVLLAELQDRIAVVTGASSGIGRRTAEVLAAQGALVAVFARSRGPLEEMATAFPDRVLFVEGDVAEPAAVDRLFDAVEQRFGDCDILINCAGMVGPKPLVETSVDEWDQLLNVNLRSMFLTCRRAVPPMMARRRGTIVNVASISGVPGVQKFPGFVSYCASKAGVIGLTEALAAELKDYGIRVNCVSPGSVDTAMLHLAGAGLVPDMSPSEVAAAILFLASDRSRPINGQNMHVYGV
jgi:NAD(P)-dependent dehydrogenase (short-subunit alcohol dehydrogenase family)